MISWNGRMVRVDLTSGKIGVEEIGQKFRLNYLGARGINSRYLFDEISPGVDPLSPSNVLIIGSGILTRMGIPGATRYTITAKSPLTGILGDANAGGTFGIALKEAGYDHIIVTGKAERPVYLWVDNVHVEIREASHIWGKTTWETAEEIRRELGDEKISVASIGQAGENLVRFACVVSGLSSVNGRTGMGAVMGSKNLKAIAVRRGESFPIPHPEEFERWKEDLLERVGSLPYYAPKAKYGTICLTRVFTAGGFLPAKNLSRTMALEDDNGVSIEHESISERFTGIGGCPDCFIHCKHNTEIEKGPYKGEKGGGIEYASTSAYGNHCLMFNPDSLLKLNNLSNQYGIDVMTGGYTLGFAMDWHEQGLISKKDMDGIDLTWGNDEAMIQMIHKIAKREGFGAVLAEGPVRAATQIGKGTEKYITHSKGLDFCGGEESRAMKGYALNMATSTIGAHHCRGITSVEMFIGGLTTDEMKQELKKKFGIEEEITSTSYNKASITAHYQDISTVTDALGLCAAFTESRAQVMGFKEMAELFYLVTGIEIGEEGLRKAARRIYNVEKAFLAREGITKKDDYIYGKLAHTAVVGGTFKGEILDREKFTKMLEDYYAIRGWNKDTGIPTRTTLEEYGLGDIADQLEKIGL
jgi:aldehyde:ferredoxin oxidoreductase